MCKQCVWLLAVTHLRLVCAWQLVEIHFKQHLKIQAAETRLQVRGTVEDTHT